MADPSSPTPPQSEEQNQSSTKPKCRRATRLRDLTFSRDDNRARFTSYVALLGRSKVPEEVKNKIWQTIMLTYDVPNNNLLRSKWISYAGQRWRGFKSDLTSRYIYEKLSHKNPCETYQFLDEETWQAFRDKQLEHSFQEKRKVAQDLQKNNVHPHRLSHGGYDRLEEIMIREASSLATDDQSDLSLISPPPRHEKWKRARTKPSGEYTSEETRLIAEKIDIARSAACQPEEIALPTESPPLWLPTKLIIKA
ncbi:hypothetical protein V8G54_021491 [Vigna mungo]|uniref:Uncharacterized protein n=1 Tax=Vigna mungo TaxID=3915 RepID=A0AAQ3NDF2_VIGMU